METNKNVVICPPCGESTAVSGAYKDFSLISPSIGSADHFLRKGGRNSGFTLIELLVVILIIGILVAVALPQYQKAVYKARATEAVLMANTLQKAVDLYILEHGWGTAFNDDLKLDIEVPSSQCFNGGASFEYNSATNYYYTIQIAGNESCAKGLWLVVEREPNQPWSKTCNYFEGELSESFCRDLEKQGWTFGEDW